jgi:hypothetical protein
MIPSESPAEFLSNADFKLEAIAADFPNAKRLLENGLFLSHSGKDSQRIRDQILPIVDRWFAVERYFFHNRQSGASESYKQLVRAALCYCDKFFVAVSRKSIENESGLGGGRMGDRTKQTDHLLFTRRCEPGENPSHTT